MSGGPRGQGLATASLVFGIFSVLLSWLPWVGWIPFICAIICSYIVLFNPRDDTSRVGKRKAVAGLVLGLVGLFLGLAAAISWSSERGVTDLFERSMQGFPFTIVLIFAAFAVIGWRSRSSSGHHVGHPLGWTLASIALFVVALTIFVIPFPYTAIESYTALEPNVGNSSGGAHLTDKTQLYTQYDVLYRQWTNAVRREYHIDFICIDKEGRPVDNVHGQCPKGTTPV